MRRNLTINRNMKKFTTTLKQPSLLARRLMLGLALMMAFLTPLAIMTQTAEADRFDDRIAALESEIAGYQQEASRLAGVAASLQQALDSLTAQKNTIQAQVDLSQAKYDKLVAEIKANEKKLAEQQSVLTSIVSLMVAEEQITPIEILASSSSVGDFISRQDQLNATSVQLESSITSINKVKAELSQQKSDVEKVLADQTAQRNALSAKEAEQAQLVAETRNQESAYQSIIGQRSADISSLRAQQAAANAAATVTYDVRNLTSGGSRCGGYPAVWCNAPLDSLVDNWGMYNRECVSYTAWKVAASGRYMPYWGGRGNANQWATSARADGIPTGTTPKVGSVAVMYVGRYGHVMYVERINNDGTIHVSQFNWGVAGEYSEMDISPRGLEFVYF